MLAGVTFANPAGSVLADSLGYLDLAESMRTAGDYISHTYPKEDLLRPPGYPLFLTAIQTLGGSNFVYVTLAQLALSSLTSWLLFLIGRKLGHPRAGMVAAWLYALSPNIALWSITIMTETLFSFLLATAILVWVWHLKSSKLSWLALAGGVLGLAALVRPIGLYMLPLWAVVTLLAYWRTTGWRKAIGSAGVLLLSGIAAIFPWMIRNWQVHDQFTLSSVSSKTFIEFNLAYVLADVEGISRDEAVMELSGDEDLLALTIDLLRHHPVEFARTQVFGIARSLAGSETGTWAQVLGGGSWQGFGLLTGLFKGQDDAAINGFRGISGDGRTIGLFGLFAYSLVHSAVLMGLLILGVFWVRTGTRVETVLIITLSLSVIYLLAVPGAAGQARFRVPAEPELAIMAGFGWVSLVSVISKRRGSRQDVITPDEGTMDG